MAHDNGKISAPVSIWDVQLTLGESIGVLAPRRNNGVEYDLCGSPNINIWSRIKPCRYDSLDKMVPSSLNLSGITTSDPATVNTKLSVVRNTKIDMGTKIGTLGIIFPNIDNWKTIVHNATLGVVGYAHDYPTGWDGKHYYASRLQDFDGYDHHAQAPFAMEVWNDYSSFVASFKLAALESSNETDGAYVLAKAFVGNIYQDLTWRLAVGYYDGKDYHLATKESYTPNSQQSIYNAESGFLDKMDKAQTHFSIRGDIKEETTYQFVGLLLGYKTVSNSDENHPVGYDTDAVPIIDDSMESGHDRYCAIPMPCSAIKIVVGKNPNPNPEPVIPSTITVTGIDIRFVGSTDTSSSTVNADNNTSHAISVYVNFYGGSSGITLGKSDKVSIKIWSNDASLRPTTLNIVPDVSVGVKGEKTVVYTYGAPSLYSGNMNMNVCAMINGVVYKIVVMDFPEITDNSDPFLPIEPFG